MTAFPPLKKPKRITISMLTLSVYNDEQSWYKKSIIIFMSCFCRGFRSIVALYNNIFPIKTLIYSILRQYRMFPSSAYGPPLLLAFTYSLSYSLVCFCYTSTNLSIDYHFSLLNPSTVSFFLHNDVHNVLFRNDVSVKTKCTLCHWCCVRFWWREAFTVFFL